MEQTLEDRWSPAFITHRLRHRGEWSLSLRWSVGQLPDPRAFLRNKRRVPSMFDIVIRIVTVVYIYIHIYIYTCMRACALSWLAIPFYSHLESTHLTSQTQQISSVQQSVHPLQTATGLTAIMNGDDKRPFNHIQTYR